MQEGEEFDRESVTAYRLLSAVVAAVVAVIGVFRHLRPGEYVDPLWARSLVVLSFAFVAVGSFTSGRMRRRLPHYFYGLCLLLASWTAYILWLNELDPSLVTMFNLVVLVTGLSLGILEVETSALAALMLYCVALAVAATLGVSVPKTNPSVFVTGLVGSLGAVTVVISLFRRSRLRQREAEEQWRSVVAAHPDAILVHVGDRIVYGNDRALGMFQPQEGESFLGAPVDAVDPRLTTSNGAERETELDLRTTGGVRHFKLRSSPVWFQGNLATQVTLNDRTEEVERQRLLERAREAAEDATRTKSNFLAIISHEIRTPLNGIIGLTELLADEELDDRSRECVNLIRSSGDSLSMIINDILDFSKAEGGHLVLEKVSFGVREVVAFGRDVMMPKAREKGIELVLDVDADVPDSHLGDPLRVRQIVLNLVSNAIKFTSEGSVRGRVSVLSNGDGVHLEVEDTGIGIPPDQLSRLFEPFSQADASTSRRFGGTGLGLSICRQLSELMGGRIWAESEPERGSTFHVELPLKATNHTAPAVVPTERPSNGLRILLAEDNRVNQRVATAMLRKLGHEVVVAETGVEVLGILETDGFDVILMDMMMPEMGGIEAAEHLRKRTDLAQPRIVALTANALEEDRRRCFEAGMDDFLAKPLRRAELMEALSKVQRPSLAS